jgi:hypothetical protein
MLDLNELEKVAQVIYLIADESITDKSITDNMSDKIKAAVKEIEDLREFSRYLTGCGYDFTQHKCFCEYRDRLLR